MASSPTPPRPGGSENDETVKVWQGWRQTQDPKAATRLLESLDPVIDKALHSYGYAGDPNMKATARLHALSVLPRFNPEKAKMDTFVFNELKRLQRLGPRQQYAIPIPERAAIDIGNLRQAEVDLTDTLGREPSSSELADHTGLSTDRIKKLKSQYGRPMLTEADIESGEMLGAMPGQDAESAPLWAEAVYIGLSPSDQLIYDHTLGAHGKPSITKTQIAEKLGISVSAVTQRAQRISAKLKEGESVSIAGL